MEINKNILLTGAGFTKNFGGYLGHEMYDKIFNNPLIQQSPKIRELLEDDYDFESIYSIVMGDNNFSAEDRSIIEEALEGAYKKLDDNIRDWRFDHNNPQAFNVYGLMENCINHFSANGKKNFIFTLNQDILMERKYNYRSSGVPPFPQDFISLSSREFEKRFYVTTSDESVEKAKQEIQNNDFNYIKLHGSYGWQFSSGRKKMVIGKNKENDINSAPLLKLYFDTFKELIKSGNKKLFIMGYGFADKHINELIFEGVEQHNLKLFIISTMTRRELKEKMNNGQNYLKNFTKGICGYWSYPLREIYPPDQSITSEAKEIKNAIIAD